VSDRVGALLPWFVVIIAGQLLYHLVLKGLDDEDNAIGTIVVAYGTGVVLLVLFALLTGSFSTSDRGSIDWLRACLVGLGVTMIEMGFLMAYRYGLPVSFGALAALSVTTLILFPLGIVVFREGVGVEDVAGCALVLGGLYLLAR